MTYGVHALAGWTVVTAMGAFQHVVVLGVSLDVGRLVIPMVVGTVSGLLVAKYRAMSRRIATQFETIRASEARIAALNETLEERVAARTQQLRAQEAELAEARRVESVGRLASGLAHDFNNLLTAVLLATDDLDYQLAQGAQALDVGEAQEVLAEITAAARRGAALTRQLLTYARRDEVHLERFDVREAIKALRPMLGRLLGGGVAFVCELPPAPCPVLMDRGQLEQVLVNLTTNAAEAMGHQGRFEVALTSDPSAGEVLLRVSDDGVGMPEEVRQQAFDAFYTTKGLGRGTGLGLATVHGIILGAGGRIDVHSEVGVGTVFEIALPRAELASEAEARPVAPLAPASSVGDVEAGGARPAVVLLVDDEDVVRGVTRRLLATRGYEVLEAPHGAAALEVLRERGGGVDLVITDRVMPVMGGAALVAELNRAWPTLPVVVVSGHAEAELPPRPLGAGPLRRISKPFSARQLFEGVEQALRG